jgi:diguanylate cyclase (GGDEF)-like protein/PAS domain S-box-containing protein
MTLVHDLSLPSFVVLIIEDNTPDAELLEAYLEGSPITTDHVESVGRLEKAIDRANTLEPSLIFLDLSLNDASTRQSLDAISKFPAGASVIVLTGQAQPEVELDALEHGADEFIQKNDLNVELLTRRVYHAHGRQMIRSKLQARQEELETYETIVKNTTDAVFITDPDGTYRFVNERFAALMDRPKSEIEGETARHLEPVRQGQFGAPGRVNLEGTQVDHREHEVLLADQNHTFLTTQIPIRTTSGPGGIIGISRDISEQKKLRNELERQALFDELTSLPNRSLFEDRLQQALRRAARGECDLGIGFIDVDNFKKINDRYGHTSGDIVLREVSSRLVETLRSSDTIARHGGDEFMVLLEADDELDFESVGERIRQSLEPAIQLDDTTIEVTLSIGFARPEQVEPTDSTVDHTIIEDLIRAADRAMYSAKDTGNTSWSLYDTDSPGVRFRQAELENRIHEGIARDEFVPFFQPIFSLPSQRVVALEVLARWRRDDLGLVQPSEFVELAEQSQLICDLGEVIADKACRQVMGIGLTDDHDDDIALYINLSPKQLELPERVDDLLAVVDSYASHIPIGFEVTESQLLQSYDPLVEFVRLGHDVIVDDFGSGYSSFERIKEMEVDALKLDMNFVQGAITNDADAAIVETVATLGRRLGIPTVGEGVESPRQLQFLKDAGFSAVQGFHLGRPQPLDELVDSLKITQLDEDSTTLVADTVPERTDPTSSKTSSPS